ncbi:hypothetical protein SAMN04488041_103145 [Sulfitobacter pontiacus]|uniref:Uncharacterized protein n=2 Tax=Sulfitobacter pontiacus TaxID=60137 RepID=A0A1H2W4A9_9RHOB|nr:hypothetical protein SAMN04488041_103145 [Sulfitobacter pontiacus]
MVRLAASGVAKVDLLGPRGTTLCTMDEIEAMAAMIVAAGVLPGHPSDPARQPYFVEVEGSIR